MWTVTHTIFTLEIDVLLCGTVGTGHVLYCWGTGRNRILGFSRIICWGEWREHLSHYEDTAMSIILSEAKA